MGRKEKLTELSEAFTKAGVRTLLTDGDTDPLLAVWRNPTDRYASEVVGYYVGSRVTGSGYQWGSSWQYGAPETATPEMIVAMVQETLE